ncbi:MAG: copper homeostasis protein CutC [Treponema sp.]|jgi:copper homeostasis protein|nr:copper homeostasis protein CutC [Treponema sp.]
MKDDIILELCIENGTRIDELIAKGADRVELCDNLAAGGTTVSYGVAAGVIRRCRSAGVKVMAMIRPRGGNFVYDDNEFAAMLDDTDMMLKLGAGGIVFGCLTAENRLDREKNLCLIRMAELPAVTSPDGPLSPADSPAVTGAVCSAGSPAGADSGIDRVFHMAFDHINPAEQLDSIRWLADNGVTRILTHGSADLSIPIEQNYTLLREYAAAAGAAVEILPGGGITAGNYREICAALGVRQVHGTRVL